MYVYCCGHRKQRVPGACLAPGTSAECGRATSPSPRHDAGCLRSIHSPETQRRCRRSRCEGATRSPCRRRPAPKRARPGTAAEPEFHRVCDWSLSSVALLSSAPAARRMRVAVRMPSPVRLAQRSEGRRWVLRRPSDCSACPSGGLSSGRMGLLRHQHAGIDRRIYASLHARNGNINGATRRVVRPGKAFECAFIGQHRCG